jgi:hypothetical protein
VPGPFKFTGHSKTGYPDYADMATGRMLVAEPGESYEIRAVNQGAPVPPDDGRWDPPYVRPRPAPAPEDEDGGTVLHGEPGVTVGGPAEGSGR